MEFSWASQLVAEQQVMSGETLKQLHKYGVVDNETMLRLDFNYTAPGESQARSLAAFLVRQTDYDVEALRQRRGLRREWGVHGQTGETPVSAAIINDWIQWMVIAGADNGECRFDGWGATVPD